MDCTADAADASFDATAFDEDDLGRYSTQGWYLMMVYIDHDAVTTPDASYDVTLTDTVGMDLLGGSGAAIDGTGGDIRIMPQLSSSDTAKMYSPVTGELTLTITNNSTNSAGVDFYLFLVRD